MITPEVAAERPVEIIECGPAAGIVGCANLAQRENIGSLITFDMGGTTTKSSIVEDAQYTRSPEYEIGGGIHRASRLLKGKGYVVRVPSIDIAEIGSGGGSILRVDAGGALHIGPESAGAVPGPACYNLGGTNATITDVNTVLGYLNQNYLVGGELKLAPEKAFQAIKENVAKALGIDVIEAAYGAYSIANANMLRAIRAVSSERGRDPRRFILYAFGGAGPMHAVGVAKGLGIKQIIVPPAPGVCSAYGLTCADIERHYAQAFSHIWQDSVLDNLNRTLEEMEKTAIESAEVWGGREKVSPGLNRFVGLRYEGQSFELSIPVPSGKLGLAELVKIKEDFEKEHEKTYGHCLPGYSVQAVVLRLMATLPTEQVILSTITSGIGRVTGKTTETRKAYWGQEYGFVDTKVLQLEQVSQSPIEGPVLVDCYDTTIVIPPKVDIALGDWGNVTINIKDEVS
jgi:N-methylhydantoinase A